MRRTIFAAAAAVVVIASTRQVSAICCDDGAMYVKQGYHANAMWPWPYVCPDRIAVREPFCIMVNNGWRRQNMLGAHHFVPETNQLNAAGQLRVQWIMTQAPADRRNIFVERSLDPNTTNQRIAAVQEYSTLVSLDGHPAPISQTHLVSEGRPATIVDFTNTKFQQSMPLPVLPAAQPSGGSSASAQ
jgi:hypothetical protein